MLNVSMILILQEPSGTISEIFFSLIYSVFQSLYHQDFLTEILAIESAILAFFVPLSYNIMARATEKYDSKTINELFLNEKNTFWLLWLLLVNIAIIILYKASTPSFAFTIFPLISLILFFIMLGFLVFNLGILKKIIFDEAYVVRMLSKQRKKAFEQA